MQQPSKLPSRLSHLKCICPQQKNVPNLVYLVGCNEFVKIGITSNLVMRMNDLQVGNPYSLVLFSHWVSDDAVREEEAIHSHLDAYHHRGEWFKLPKQLLDLVTLKQDSARVQELLLTWSPDPPDRRG